LQCSSQVYLRCPPAATPELRDVAGNDGFIALAHQFRILLYVEIDLNLSANCLDDFCNGVMPVSSEIVDFPRLAALRCQPEPTHEISYIDEGATLVEVAHPEGWRVHAEFDLNRPLRKV
jgi:hypothetical protein